MQSRREIVKAAIEFSLPERLPVMMEAFNRTDRWWVHRNSTGRWNETKGMYFDEWNCGWGKTEQHNMGQVVDHPISEWSDLSSYKWPDPDAPEMYEGMEKHFAGAEDRYIVTDIFMLLFERMHSLRGFENTLMDLYLERENIEALADRIVEHQMKIIENVSRKFPSKIDGMTFTDDWGTETALFISPSLWREFFKPRYKRLFDAMHNAGWHVWMHSCGKVNDIIGDLIDIGCNVVNLQQPRAIGIKEIGEKYAGKICFESLCDIQHTLPFCGKDEIEAEAELLLQSWGTDSGGFIFSDYGDGEAIGVPDSKKAIMMEAFLKLDRWK